MASTLDDTPKGDYWTTVLEIGGLDFLSGTIGSFLWDMAHPSWFSNSPQLDVTVPVLALLLALGVHRRWSLASMVGLGLAIPALFFGAVLAQARAVGLALGDEARARALIVGFAGHWAAILIPGALAAISVAVHRRRRITARDREREAAGS